MLSILYLQLVICIYFFHFPSNLFTFSKTSIGSHCFIVLFLRNSFGCPGEGTGSETGDYSNGITATTLVTRTGHPTSGTGPTDGEDFLNASSSVSGTGPQGVQDQFKPSHDSNTGKKKFFKFEIINSKSLTIELEF